MKIAIEGDELRQKITASNFIGEFFSTFKFEARVIENSRSLFFDEIE